MRRVMIALVFMLAGCEGAAGPTGPQGPTGAQGAQGAQGDPGVVNRLMMTGVPDTDGTVEVFFPESVGTSPSQPPALDCYVSSDPSSGIWIAVNDGYWVTDSPWCALGFASGRWGAVMVNVPIGWTAAFVVVY